MNYCIVIILSKKGRDMYRFTLWLLLGFIFITITFFNLNCEQQQDLDSAEPEQTLTSKQQLGKKLFHDRNLSTPPGQACVDCHLPESGFSNPNFELPVSQGVIKDRFGNRNDLIAAYASFSPEFHYDAEADMYFGGMFWDGRAANLEEQAKGPFLNPLEMANPDEAAVIEKIRNSDYVDLFHEVFGDDALQNIENAYNMVAEAIAEYERSGELNKFNSKYDYYLEGKVALSEQEMRGLALFEDEKKGQQHKEQ